MTRNSRCLVTRAAIAVFGTLALLGASAAALAQPSGSVSFTGPGAALLPSPTFVPHTYVGDESSWSFFDDTEQVGVVVIELLSDPSRASLVSVTLEGGATWLQIGFTGVAGVTIQDDTIEFQNVSLPQSARAALDDLVLNGSLTRPPVSISGARWGSIKTRFRPSTAP